MDEYEMNDLLIQSIAAGLTLITIAIALYQSWKNSKRINDLALIVKQLADANKHAADLNILTRKQMAVDVEPLLKVNHRHIDAINHFSFVLENHGQIAFFRTMLDKPHFCEITTPMPELIRSNQQLSFAGKYHSGRKDFSFQVYLTYADKYGNEYEATIFWTETKLDISYPRLHLQYE